MKFNRVQEFLAVSSVDPVQSRRARMLNILLLGLTLLTVVTIIVNLIGTAQNFFTEQERLRTLWTSLFFLASSFFIYWINKRWSSRLAATLFLIVVTAGLFYGDTPYETIWGRNMVALVIPILMASLILEPRASFVMAAIISFVSVGLASLTGQLPNIVGIVLYFALALISWLTTRSLEQAIKDLKATNVELDQRVEARTAELLIANKQLKTEVQERLQAETALEEERGLLAERVEQRTAEIREANSRLQELLKVKDEFLAKMSHELRTPLSVMLIRAEVLQMGYLGELNEKQMENLVAIDENGQHLLTLINDILDVARIQAGHTELDYTFVPVANMCQAVFKLIEPLAKNKQMEIEFHMDAAIELVETDEKRLRQILINLLTNAIKFTPAGGRVGLDIESDAAQELICFSVWDTGIGIRTDDLEKLFEPFVQLDNSITRQYEGSGLGLTLVKQFTELLGGELSVVTELDEGSRFTVALPKMRQPVYHTLVADVE